MDLDQPLTPDPITDHPIPPQNHIYVQYFQQKPSWGHHGGRGITGVGVSQGVADTPMTPSMDLDHPTPSKSYLCPIFLTKTIMGASDTPVMPPWIWTTPSPQTLSQTTPTPPLKIIFMQYILCQNLIHLTESTSNINIYPSTLVFVENIGNFFKFVKIKKSCVIIKEQKVRLVLMI